MNRMRLLPLHENDLELFNSNMNRTLYMLYREKVEQFTVMWTKQGPGYWIKFCITLRSVMQKQGYSIHLASLEKNHFDSFFKSLILLLTGDSAEALNTYVKDVVSVSRFHQLLSNIPEMFVSRESQLSPSFKRLFGIPTEDGNIIKMFATLPLHIRAVGCLMELLRRWPDALTLRYTTKPWWKPPQSWHYGNQLKASSFEVFLKKHWGDKLLELIDVRVADICWWNALPQGDRISEIHERYTDLGSFISKACKDLKIPVVEGIKVLGNEMFHCYFLNTSPRGSFTIFCNPSSVLVYVAVTLRGLFLTNKTTVFHPFSQIIISFTNAAFSRIFWYGNHGLVTELNRLSEAVYDCPFPPELLEPKEKVDFMLEILINHMTKAQLAIKMNSNFYSTLFRQTDWTIAINLQRFPWNLPLCLNWLEILLTKIYEFERYFIPIVHFQVCSDVVCAVQTMYRKISEAKFLTKSCIIIVEVMIQRENNESGRCYEARKLLHAIIPTLARYMNFLEEDTYRALDAILKTGWNKEEREDGECSLFVKDRITNDLKTWNTVPNIDPYYCENFRSIIFWITRREWPDISNEHSNYNEVFETLKNYKIGSTSTVPTNKEPYDFQQFNYCAKDMKFVEIFASPGAFKIGFISLILRLITEDGWITSEMYESFWPKFDFVYNLDNIKFKLNNKVKDIPDEGLVHMNQIENIGTVYYVMACVLGDTWKSNVAEQNSLAQLHRSEAHAFMADLGARLSAMIQRLTDTAVVCPPANYFKEAAAEIRNHTSKKQTTLKEVDLMFEHFDRGAIFNMRIETVPALQSVNVPQLEDMQFPKIGLAWLLYLENKREALLQLVSDKQFELLGTASKKHGTTGMELFPLYDVLEYRFLEEMAAMQKCLELGGIFYGPAYGLCRLIAHRFEWLQEKFKNWGFGKIKFAEIIAPMSPQKIKQALVDIRIRMMEALIYLKSLFFTYISQYRTTHPINEMTIEMLFEWVDVARTWILNDRWNFLGSSLTEYVRALEKSGCEYLEQLLRHCKRVWVVMPFVTSPDANVDIGGINHAQQIVTTFTQLFLMGYHLILSRSSSINPALKLSEKLEEALVNVTIMLRKLELEVSTLFIMWPKIRQKLKKELRQIWSDLLEMRKEFGGPFSKYQCPDWIENKDYVWRQFLELYTNNQYQNILSKIAFSEFINTHDPDKEEASNSNTKKESKQNKSKENTNSTPTEDVKVEIKQNNKGKKNKKKTENDSKEDVSFEVRITQIKTKDSCQFTIIEKEAVIQNSNNEHKKPGNEKFKSKNKSQNKVEIKEIKQNIQIKDIKQEKLENIDNETNKIHDEKEHQTEVSYENSVKFEDKHIANKMGNSLRTCTYCSSMEPVKRTYKKCGQCKKEGWLQPRFYCSQECQVRDWKERHNLEHKNAKICLPVH